MNRAQYPSDVIALVVFWRLRYKLSLRDLPEMFLLRGIEFTYEAVRDWEAKLTPLLIDNLRRRRGGGSRVRVSWYVDETHIKVHGRWCYLYRAIYRGGALVDVMLSETRDLAAAETFFRSLAGLDVEAFVRAKLLPMVRGYFRPLSKRRCSECSAVRSFS